MKKLLQIAFLMLMAMSASPSAQAACWQWSKTASTNATADPTINWAEGMSPSSVNDSARAMMARSAECRDDLSGALTSAGTATAYTLTTNQSAAGNGIASPALDGQQLTFRPNLNSGVAPTLRVDGGTAYPIQTSPGVAVAAGVLVAGTPYRVSFNLASLAWVLQDFYNSTIAAGSIQTSMLADQSVTRQKLYHPSAAQRLLGSDASGTVAVTGAGNNGSGAIRLTVPSSATFTAGQVETVAGIVGTTEANGTWALTIVDGTHVDLVGSTFTNAYVSGGTLGGGVSEIGLGTGLSMVFSTLNGSQPLAGVQGLVITNNTGTPNSIIDITADQAVMVGGSATAYATAVSVSVNTSINGAGGMDTGGRPTSGWVNVFLISNGAATAGLASLSATAPTMPSGYTFAVRVGAMRTDSSQNFLRTKQTGNDVQYVVTTATNTATLPVIQVQGAGTIAFWTALSISNFVPPTATRIRAVLYITASGSAMVGGIAPNNNYPTGGNGQSVNHFGQFGFQATGLGGSTSIQADMMIESTNIYYGGVALGVDCQGWKDKVNAS